MCQILRKRPAPSTAAASYKVGSIPRIAENDLNRITSETFDTYVYQIGRVQGNYGYSTAVSLFKSVISIICIQTANRLAKKAGQDGLF